MRSFVAKVVFGFLVCLGVAAPAWAGEWSEWDSLPGNHVVGRDGVVKIRHRAEGGGDGKNGYRFYYEVRNTSQEHTAIVHLAFDNRNSKTGKWTRAEEATPGLFTLKPGRGSTVLTAVILEPTFGCTSSIEWEDVDEGEGSAEEEKTESTPAPAPPESPLTTTAAPARPPEADAGYSRSLVPGVAFRVSLNDGTELNTEIWRVVYEHPGALFSGDVVLKVSPTWDHRWDWLKHMQELVANKQAEGLQVQILSSNSGEIRIKFERATGDLIGSLIHSPLTAQSFTLVAVGKSTAKEVGAAPTKPASGDGANADAIIPHEGYWGDMGDRSLKPGAKEPVHIYVRVKGQALRVPLSLAKSKYAVPANASLATMSIYSEGQKTLISNRGTHVRK